MSVNSNYSLKFLTSSLDFQCVVGAPPFYLVNTRMRSKRDIKKGRLCTGGGGGVLLVGV